jgi:hypothetical protein
MIELLDRTICPTFKITHYPWVLPHREEQAQRLALQEQRLGRLRARTLVLKDTGVQMMNGASTLKLQAGRRCCSTSLGAAQHYMALLQIPGPPDSSRLP